MQVFDFQFIKVGGSPIERLTKSLIPLMKPGVPGAVPGVGFTLIASVLCL